MLEKKLIHSDLSRWKISKIITNDVKSLNCERVQCDFSKTDTTHAYFWLFSKETAAKQKINESKLHVSFGTK